MKLAQILHSLKESGLCVDRVRLLEYLLEHAWLKILFFRCLRVRFSPQLIRNATLLSVDKERSQKLFSLASSYINVGRTYKTTGAARTVIADEAILRLARKYDAPRLLEVGVSDGSSALGLLEQICAFGEIELTDFHNAFYQRRIPLGYVFYDGNRCFLGLKLLFFYLNMPSARRSSRDGLEIIRTSNPTLCEKYGVKVAQFNVFTDRSSKPFHLIKCSNLLTKTYFSDAELLCGVSNLGRSLTVGGHLVLSHNSDVYQDGEALIILRRDGDILRLDAVVNSYPLARLFEGRDVLISS